MAGIAGIGGSGQTPRLERMLDRMAHRGRAGRAILERPGATLGVVWTKAQTDSVAVSADGCAVRDAAGAGHLAQAEATSAGIVLTRDEIGVAPLYYGTTDDGLLCFASEVKALLGVARVIHELPPGHRYKKGRLERYFALRPRPALKDPPAKIAAELRRKLAASVAHALAGRAGEVGSWLSGGLDSSVMAALARPHVKRLATFAAGVPGAPDLEFARAVASFLRTRHHEVVVGLPEMLAALPEVIWHLESFDALLVRSSITNYLVARRAGEHVAAVFSGEGGDELFAGYEYLKSLPARALPAELLDITARLHNTALQRVDRSASAHGTVAHVRFLDPAVVDYALRIPVAYKLRDGVEKWILRQALAGALPAKVLSRTKAKFWEGAGVGEQLAGYAEKRVSDADFRRLRKLPNRWELNTKEELLYYRVFREHFGKLADLSWMGRTKGAPRSP